MSPSMVANLICTFQCNKPFSATGKVTLHFTLIYLEIVSLSPELSPWSAYHETLAESRKTAETGQYS